MTLFKSIQPSEMDQATFVSTFADIYEHSPWVAKLAYEKSEKRQLNDMHYLHQLMSECLLEASPEQQLAVINAHPDLAGKAAIQGQLTASSTSEQSGAGIHECSAEEFARFTQLNNAYKEKFKFPFIMAVKGSNRYQILSAFESRIHNDIDAEFNQALLEINRIALFRLELL